MRKFACVLGILLLAGMSLGAAAQTKATDNSRLSVFAGYSLLHYNNGTDPGLYGSGELDNTANANGFVASAAYSLNSMFAIVGEYGFYHAGSVSNTGLPSSVAANANLQTYLFGPKISYRSGPITPFAQVLVGGAHATFKESSSSVSVTGPGASGLGLAVGGGLDWKVTPHLSIRPAQFEYLMTKFTNSNTLPDYNSSNGVPRPGDGGNGKQNNFRYSAGVVFNF